MHSTLSSSINLQKKIAFVSADWHADIVNQSRESFSQHLSQAGIADGCIDYFNVPGSLEIPLRCKQLADSGDYQVIVAAGLVVDGGIYRHDFVAATVLQGMMDVQLGTGIPILSVVLTPHHFNDQPEHRDFFHEHFKIKGKEAGEACLQLLSQMEIPKFAA